MAHRRRPRPDHERLPPGFRTLIAAQFTSALADNALLIVTIAWLHHTGTPAWWSPLLKVFFIGAYVVLAPVVGPLADVVAKARLMGWMNGLKLCGVAALCVGIDPLAAFAIVGLGAAAYAPAKYGLVTEIVAPARLVRANAWIETSVVAAVLLGTVLGGALVAPVFFELAQRAALVDVVAWLGIADGTPLGASMLMVALIYGLASVLNLGVPDSGVRHPRVSIHPLRLARGFAQSNRVFWRDRAGALSLAVTTLFWGAGAVLQFAVLRWSIDVLGLTLDRAAYLQACVAIGVVLGAVLAGRFVALKSAPRMLPAGIVLGLLVALGGVVDTVAAALPLLVAVGVAGGLLVVPMNALLQHRGVVLLTAGRSIAVQGFNENLSVLAMLGVYAALLALQVSIVPILVGFGLFVALLMALVMRACGSPRSP